MGILIFLTPKLRSSAIRISRFQKIVACQLFECKKDGELKLLAAKSGFQF